ncbi:MAG: UDP-N-acetylmuramate dehydrogenase [Planctomycetota bacterium]
MDQTIQLRHLTTFGIGGTPMRYYRPHAVPELRAALADCRRLKLPWRVLGGGSNLLVAEGQLPFCVIHIQSPGFDVIERAGPTVVQVGAGVPTAKLLTRCREWGLGGLEFLAGLPGTVGGAIAGNAGAWGCEVCQRVTQLWLVSPQGTERLLSGAELEHSYREAHLDGAILTQARFELERRDPGLVGRLMAERLAARAARHPLGEPSAGCVFRNPPGNRAGRLLDLCGMKGRGIGGAQVSRIHANFIVNTGGAVARDVLSLVQIMRESVLRDFGIELELEVRHWPAQSKAA